MTTPPRSTDAHPFLVTHDGGGSVTRGESRHARFVLTSRGVRLPAGEADDVAARWLAAHLPLRSGIVLSHPTAAQLLGLPLPRALEDLTVAHVTTPRGASRPRRRDLVSHHAQLPAEDVVHLWGLPITSPARTYVDMASLLDHADLVALGDVVMRRFNVSRETLLGVARQRLRFPGRGKALAAVAWLDPRAESPRESHLRVLLRQARLPLPEVNADIVDEQGRFLARGDLVFRRERVIVEYDGEVHASMEARAKDAARRARLREAGWIVVEIVGADMHDPARVIARVRAALRDGRERLAH